MINNLDPQINNPANYKYGIFYYNTNDTRVFVPKRNKYMGWTLNFANHFTYLIFGAIISMVIVFNIFL